MEKLIMKNLLNKYLPKKFKVRVRHFDNSRYMIEYAYFRLIPNYKRIWGVLALNSGIHANAIYQLWLGEWKEAVDCAKTFKSIEDVKKLNKKRKELLEWCEKERKKEKPFKTKQIL